MDLRRLLCFCSQSSPSWPRPPCPPPPPQADPLGESGKKTSLKNPQVIWFVTMLFRKSLLGRFPGAFTLPAMKI